MFKKAEIAVLVEDILFVISIIVANILEIEALPIIVLVLLGITINFMPSCIAFDNQHKDKALILGANFIFGWTIIGWFICLVWASKKEVNKGKSENKYEDLEKLQRLKESGILTEVEFENEKQKILK